MDHESWLQQSLNNMIIICYSVSHYPYYTDIINWVDNSFLGFSISIRVFEDMSLNENGEVYKKTEEAI